jgi:perosamine synthetase
MNLLREFGVHKIYDYDINEYNFVEYFQQLYNEKDLVNLHKLSQNYNDNINKLHLGLLNDIQTDLHDIFYNDIKNNIKFKTLYCKFIKQIHKIFFKNQKYLIYQSFPSIRIQFPESIAVPPHKDSDSLSNHPLGERNFLLPITHMKDSNSLFIESEPDKKDFKSIELNYGEIFLFDGNLCTHYNEKNKTNKLRISLDFRVILLDDYNNHIQKLNINNIKYSERDIIKNRDPSKMIIGGYYQITYLDEDLNNMMKWYKINNILVQHRPSFSKEEADEVYKYMSSDNFITEHKKTAELEEIICKYLNCRNCIMTTSGTTAIMLALMAIDLRPGDEIIVPNYTMIATINSVKMLNLTPVIIDVDINTGTITVDTIKNYITSKTRCIIHVSLNNRYNNMEHLVSYCNENNIILIEDSAQSLGCKINGKSIGTFGELGCFSLSTPKIISTGQGGFVVTNNDNLANKIKMIKNFGRRESGVDDFITFGINLKFTDIQAVIGIEQMKKLDYRVNRIREIYNLYYKLLKDTNKIKIIKPLSDEWIPWFVDIYIEDRDNLIEYLKKHKINTRKVYGEINKTSIYYSDNTFNNSNYICNNGLFLPSYIGLENEDIIFICNVVKIFYNI